MLIDIFNNRPFQAVEMTAAFENIAYVPGTLGAMGEALFPTRRSRFRSVAVGVKQNQMTLIPTSPVGAPLVELEFKPSELRDYRTRRLAKGSTIYAEELQGLLQAPELQQVRGMQEEIAFRGTQIRADMELTEEHMRFGAVMGKVIDADGTTVLDDWYANWGVTEPTPIDFGLDVATTNVREIVHNLRTDVRRNSLGAWVQGRTVLHALCGSHFFSSLITHPQIERTYLNTQSAAELRGEIADEFPFGGIVWHNFQSTADGTTIAIPDDECHIFPVGGNSVFQRVMGPAEFEPFINQPGRDIYAMNIPDRDRGAWNRVEAYIYPLYMCLRPHMLRKGVTT